MLGEKAAGGGGKGRAALAWLRAGLFCLCERVPGGGVRRVWGEERTCARTGPGSPASGPAAHRRRPASRCCCCCCCVPVGYYGTLYVSEWWCVSSRWADDTTTRTTGASRGAQLSSAGGSISLHRPVDAQQWRIELGEQVTHPLPPLAESRSGDARMHAPECWECCVVGSPLPRRDWTRVRASMHAPRGAAGFAIRAACQVV